jgi:acyl CoA:acetate/3-ketoacid CoA transferase beta subunit
VRKKSKVIPREWIALRIAKEIPDGSYVNLGIGVPTLVSNWIEGRDTVMEAEVSRLNTGTLTIDKAIDQEFNKKT